MDQYHKPAVASQSTLSPASLSPSPPPSVSLSSLSSAAAAAAAAASSSTHSSVPTLSSVTSSGPTSSVAAILSSTISSLASSSAIGGGGGQPPTTVASNGAAINHISSFSSLPSSSPIPPPSQPLPPALPQTPSPSPTTTTTTTTSTTATSGGEPKLFPSNKSPVTIFSVPHKQYKPDHLASIDLIIIVIYLCLLLSTSISTMIRTRKSIKRKAALAAASNRLTGSTLAAPTQNNFLASRKMNWFTVGASIFASNLGSEHFIGLSGSAAANGISVAAFEMNALIILQLATWIFLPVLIAAKISTLPEYMSKRFGGKRIRTYLAVLSILLYIFTKISVNLFSGGIFIQQAVGWNLYTSAMFILALTCIMTLTGGLKGAMMIDNLQAIVMTVGASIVSASALIQIGGWQGLKTKYSLAVPSKVPANLTHCAQPNPRAFQMLRPSDDRDMPWLGFIIGQTPASIWYWAADQMMVQRFLSARSLAHVQGSAVFAGYLKILPLVFMIIPGMISRCLYTDEVGCIDPVECQRYCQSTVSCSNTAYPRLVLELMPRGARGMMVAAMVAALMQDLCNVFNSASALFSCDIWPLCRPNNNQKEQEAAGRVFVICLVFASIMWIPVIQEMQGGQLFIYIQAVAAMFWPPICAVYICAVMWKRTNETGAFWSLMLGFLLGLLRMVLSFMYKEPSCGQHLDERPWILQKHYMYYAAFLFWTTILSVIVISKLTRPPAPFRLIRTTFWTRFDTNIRKDDKNVFEMKYSGATTTTGAGCTTTTTATSNNNNNNNSNNNTNKSLSTGKRNAANGLHHGDNSAATPGDDSADQKNKLFTIEEQQEKKSADLSSVIVDINKAAANPAAGRPQEPQTAPITMQGAGGGPLGQKQRSPVLQHQASLTASATAAVGEAGKFLASKLAHTEANLRGARDMVLAAANHFTGGAIPDSRIKFKNLQGDDGEEEEEDDDDDDDDEQEVSERKRMTRRKRMATESNEEEDDDGEQKDDDYDDDGKDQIGSGYLRSKRSRRSRRSQSMLGAALSSYKQKRDGGYKIAMVDEEDDEDDDDDQEMTKLNKSFGDRPTMKRQRAAEFGEATSSSTDDRHTPTHHGSSTPLTRSKSTPGRRARRHRGNKVPIKSLTIDRGSTRASYEEDEEDEDDGGAESGRTYRCLDNSVALLMKSQLEDTILRIAVGAIVLVAIGIFILLSLPPATPPKEIAEILIKT